MVWRCNKDVEMLNPGEYVMGDLNTLGWAIVKGYECTGETLVQFSKDMMAQIAPGKKAPFDGWHGIQNNSKHKMQFDHFIDAGPHEEYFQNPKGSRKMRVSREYTKPLDGNY